MGSRTGYADTGLTMPLWRCRDTTNSTFENCDGLLDNRKKTLWRLEGPCAALSASLEATGGPGEYELGAWGMCSGSLKGCSVEAMGCTT